MAGEKEEKGEAGDKGTRGGGRVGGEEVEGMHCVPAAVLCKHFLCSPRQKPQRCLLAYNSCRKPHPRPSGEPAASSQHNQAAGTPKQCSRNFQKRGSCFHQLRTCTQHVIIRKSEEDTYPQKSQWREVQAIKASRQRCHSRLL